MNAWDYKANDERLWELFWLDRKLEVFNDWASANPVEEFNAFSDFYEDVMKPSGDFTPRPNNYSDLDEARRYAFIAWVESRGNNEYGFDSWLDNEFQIWKDSGSGWGVHDSE